MEQIFPENWAYMHYGLILSLTCAQMLVVYFLSDSSNPPAGLGLFTVYFMAALLGWVAFALREGSSTTLAIDVPSVAAIVNAYILFLASGQRSGLKGGRYTLGAICLLSSLSVFFLRPHDTFLVHTASTALFFAGVSIVSGWRAITHRNIGDGMIAISGILIVVGTPLSYYQLLSAGDPAGAQALAFGLYGAAYALVAIGFLASVLLEYQQHLSHLATEDPLTHLLNRRGLGEALHITLASAARHSQPMSAVMVDIDHVKNVNDSFGHEVGDHVIVQVSRVLDRMCRGSDVVARTGGDEFMLALPNTELTDARALAERVRLQIAEQPVVVDQQRIHVTISLGVASARGQIDLDELYQEADRAMYLAKRGGRNRVASVEHKPVQLRAMDGVSKTSRSL
ncbi:MAG: GGDEF domain-containing protein [Halioglobus sp.]